MPVAGEEPRWGGKRGRERRGFQPVGVSGARRVDRRARGFGAALVVVGVTVRAWLGEMMGQCIAVCGDSLAGSGRS